MEPKKTGILLVGFGGPRSLDEVAPMLRAITGTEPSTPALMATKLKYEAIGGSSPVVPITQGIAAHFEAILEMQGCVRAGMCFTPPSIPEALAYLAGQGCQRVLYLSMTPYQSRAAWDQPLQWVREAAPDCGITEILPAPPFGLSESYLATHAAYITEAREGALVFVAHSLPLDDESETPQRYTNQLLEACDAIADAVGAKQISLAFTSIGARGGRWLGPTLSEELNALAATGTREVTICPLGFATDHMEVLYDLDITARAEAMALGLRYTRTPTLATKDTINPALIDALLVSLEIALADAAEGTLIS